MTHCRVAAARYTAPAPKQTHQVVLGAVKERRGRASDGAATGHLKTLTNQHELSGAEYEIILLY